MPVAIVVGGTPKLFTIPLSATGRETTLKDMIICASAIATIGTQDAFTSDCSAGTGMACTDMPSSRSNGDWRDAEPLRPLTLQGSRRTDPFPSVGTGISHPSPQGPWRWRSASTRPMGLLRDRQRRVYETLRSIHFRNLPNRPLRTLPPATEE